MSSLPSRTTSQIAPNSQIATIVLNIGPMVLLLFMWLCTFRPPSLWRDGALTGSAVLLVITRCVRPLAFLLAKSRAGTTLLNFGYQHKKPLWEIVFWVLLSLIWMTLLSIDPLTTIFRFGVGLYILVGAISDLITNYQPTIVTDQGFYSPRRITNWDDIASRQWLNQHEGPRLILKLKNRFWPFDEAVLKVPVTLKDAVEQLLVQHRAG